MFRDIVKLVRRMMVVIAGFTVLLIGVAMIVLPGPALLVIPAGLAILGVEFLWARLLLRRIRGMADGLLKRNGTSAAAAKPGSEPPSATK
jgi:uncharacterized protein (TIGR02611 family)